MSKMNWSDYNPELSWQNCMDKVQEILDREGLRGSVDYREAAVHVEYMKLWVAAAQVHATNAQTLALRALVAAVMK